MLKLLQAVERNQSLQQAAKEIGVSYRTAWQLIEHWGRRLNMPLCVKSRGVGTRLSPLGEKLVKAQQDIDNRFGQSMHEAATALNAELGKLANGESRRTRLTAFASHDLALEILPALLGASSTIELEFVPRGSIDALKQLQYSDHYIAGFHVPEKPAAAAMTSPYLHWLDDQRYNYIHLAQREQGLMFRASHKQHIEGIHDLTRRSISFINRQRGSGTRAMLDYFLAMEGINPKDINGYKQEEFTHTAVAAMVSSGHADVGIGLKAAAADFSLEFLPLQHETYIIAYHRSLPDELQSELRELLKHPDLKQRIAQLPGYSSEQTGKKIHADKLLQTVESA